MRHTEEDIQYMRHALALAQRGLGRTWPNPSVGCVIVKNGRIVGRGRTAESGRPHAEAAALREAGSAARGASVYVTLEPCAVAGRENSCASALIAASVERVIAPCVDENPLVCGRGFEMLRAAGFEVVQGVLEPEAKAMHEGFFLRVTQNRPLVGLKIAASMDGKIALSNGRSQWITGELARRHAHGLRARHDAVLVGIGTVKADDPRLNARVDGLVHKTVRIVLDYGLEISLQSQLVKSASDYPVWVFCSDNLVDKSAAICGLEDAGVKIFPVADRQLRPILKTIAEQGITRLLVEGGAGVHSAFLKEGLADMLYFYRAPCMMGGDALGAVRDFGFEDLSQIQRFIRKESCMLGQDSLEIYRRKE